jgi:acetyl esterase
MNIRILVLILVVFSLLGAAPVWAQRVQLPVPTQKQVYKEVNGTRLEIWIWKPAGWKSGDRRPAIVFYHGGGWSGGSPTAFARQSAKLAERGMVAFSVQYRLTSTPGVTVEDCVKDAKSAFRWVVAHAAELGVDPKKVAAGGGSAGGHLAAALATLDGMDDNADDAGVSTVPAALVLFNPAAKLDFPRAIEATKKAPAELIRLSPYHHLKAGHPPCIIFHGDADDTVPIETVRDYAAKVIELGGLCELVEAPGQAHSFFNKEPHIWETLASAEAFLREQQLLEGGD